MSKETPTVGLAGLGGHGSLLALFECAGFVRALGVSNASNVADNLLEPLCRTGLEG